MSDGIHEAKAQWQSETFYPCARSYFSALLAEVDRAQESIDLSFYIFEMGCIGRDVFRHLVTAQSRGVRIRVLVDGVGTLHWSGSLWTQFQRHHIPFSVIHPLPWPLSQWRTQELSRPRYFLQLWARVNRRNHKKLAIFDRQKALVGGINISDDELEWEDFAVAVTGQAVEDLVKIFESDWQRSFLVDPARDIERKFFRRLRRHSRLISWSESTRQKLSHKKLLLRRLSGAQKIWFTTGYFVPPLSLLKLLKKRCREGADVRLIVSERSDWLAMSWLSQRHWATLLRSGVKIYLYPSRFIHAKCAVVDNEVLMGSSNLNHRSFFLDGELDIVVRSPRVYGQVHQTLMQWMSQSRLVREETVRPNWFKSLCADLLSLVKSWL